MSSKEKKHIEKTLEAAREAASQIKEAQLKAEVLAIIAIISNDSKDLKAINEIVSQIEEGPMRSEIIVIIAKKLAKAKKIIQARELVFSISSKDNYWRAEACARIALYSRDLRDFGQARRFAMMIRVPELKSEVLSDIDDFEHKPEQVKHLKADHKKEMIFADLVKALIKIKDVEGAHEIISQINGAYQRARAFADMASILAEAL